MKLKTSLWLICKTHITPKFGSSCIITAHFSSCPFIPCQAFQAGFPYAPVKTGNYFKILKYLYFFFFPQTVWGRLCLKRENQPISAIKWRKECENFLPPVRQVITLYLCITYPSVPPSPCTRYQWIWTARNWGRTSKFSAPFNQSLSVYSALSTPWLDKML